MGNKGPTRHLKRHQSPGFWPIHRKSGKWAIKTSPGTHTLATSIPVTVVVREELKYAKTAKEAKIISKEGKVFVDGQLRTDERFPLGLMDVLSFPTLKEYYRILPGHNGRLLLHPVSPEEAGVKLCKIEGKTSLSGKKSQLNLHDGTNILLSAEQDNYKVNDVLKIKIPNKEIMGSIEFKEMQQAIITGGRSQGANGTIIGFGDEPGWKKTATLRTPEGQDIRTLANYLFVVGSNEPEISLLQPTTEELVE